MGIGPTWEINSLSPSSSLVQPLSFLKWYCFTGPPTRAIFLLSLLQLGGDLRFALNLTTVHFVQVSL